MLGLQADADGTIGHVERDGQPPGLDVAVFRNLTQRDAPVLPEVDRFDDAVPAMRLVVAHEPVDERLARHQLHFRIERGADGEPALIEFLLAIAIEQFAPHFFGKEAAGDRVGGQHARMHGERLGARLLGLRVGDVAVLLHAADHVIAPLDRAIMIAERVQRARLLRQRREIGDLSDGELVHRLVEIVERRGGDAVIAEAEVDLVKIQFEDLVLRVGGLDAQAQQHFADLALDGAVGAQQKILGDLLGDGRGALDVAMTLREHDRRAQNALGIEAAMAVKVLVFGRDEGAFDEIRDRRRRQIEPALA